MFRGRQAPVANVNSSNENGAHDFMFRYYANWSAHGLFEHVQSRGLLDTVASGSSQSSRAVGNLPLTLSPVLPSLSAGKGLGETGFVTLMKPLSAAAALGDEKQGSQRHTDALHFLNTRRKIPEYLQTHLRKRCICDLKGQIRCFLTLSAGSLPVFADPNASPSATSVCPLLYPPPPLPPPSLHQIRWQHL